MTEEDRAGWTQEFKLTYKRTPEEIKREKEERKKWREEHELVQVEELDLKDRGQFKWVPRKGK